MLALMIAAATVVAGVAGGVTVSAVAGDTAPCVVEQSRVAELKLTAAQEHADPFNTVQLDALITDPQSVEHRVPGFWAGGREWRVRYASGLVGQHSYRTECSEAGDAGLHGVTGTIGVVPYTGTDPLYRHGPLRVAEDHRHLAHADGTPFFWLGDTWWMGLCHRLHWPEEFQTLTADRVAKGFTVIQIVAGLYPDMPAFDERGANEAGFPWEADYARIRPEYFDAADRRIEHLVESGLTPCVVGAWGYFLPWMGVGRLEQHWRYLIARWGAYPVVWCIAGEANLPWYLAPGFPYDDREQVKGWTEVARYVRQTDPHHRLVSIHPTGLGRLSARGAIDDVSLLDFDMLQTGHGGREVLPPTIETLRWSYAQQPTMPVLDSEVSYEALLDRIPAEIQRLMFWSCLLSGAAGHTYGANGIWQCNREDEPHGASPHGGNYGTIPWNQAMNLPGSTQLGLGKRLLERYPWERLEPHPEWAAFAREALLSLDGCDWVWFPEGSPAQDAPAETRHFRLRFELPEGAAIASATLRASADDAFVAYVNGERVGEHADWHTGKQFDDISRLLRPGPNVLAILAQNRPAPVAQNPAGLIACLEVRTGDGRLLRSVTDGTWRSAKDEVPDWTDPGFDDSAWPAAQVLGRHGDPPWGRIEGRDEFEVPYAAGIPGAVRIIYVPQRQPVTVRELEPAVRHAARWFDPVSGDESDLGVVVPDAQGTWTCFPPAVDQPDWVLVLEATGERAASAGGMTLENDLIAWHIGQVGGRPRSTGFTNQRTGHVFALAGGEELALVLSAATDRVQEPLVRVSDFVVEGTEGGDERALLHLRSPSTGLTATVHYELDGATRRKWAEVTNASDEAKLLLDVELDSFGTAAPTTGGGAGQPLFIADEAFAAVEYPSGENRVEGGHVTLTHFPGRLLQPGDTYTSHAALVSVAEAGQALPHFLSYIQDRSPRRKQALSIYTPFGINNQWGPAPTLDDEETLHVLDVLERWQHQGVRFDYFTLDTGWADPSSDLTGFRPNCYPNGPAQVVSRVRELGMQFGLWFATSWAAESCWDHPPAWEGLAAPQMQYRNGCVAKATYSWPFCFASAPYVQIVRNAVLCHIRENGVRFIKLDGGNYACDNTAHGHLPGRYSTERMYDNLVELAAAARAEAPDVFIMWYWGLRSPFWALYGDSIFESGLHMEGSGTSSTPTLHYRDSVTLAQDQNAQYARTIPPLLKDSLGVWLADTRWGNYMGKERWREALAMDLGRGSLLFPNLWGDLYLLDDEDVQFLAWISKLAREHPHLFLHRRTIAGDPWRGEVYGYAHCRGNRGFLFLSNPHFAARPASVRLDESVGLEAPAGTPLDVVSLFPERARIAREGPRAPTRAASTGGYRAGDTCKVWLRPFETLMLEVRPPTKDDGALPVREGSPNEMRALGAELRLQAGAPDPSLDAPFVDAARFAEQGFAQRPYGFEGRLPDLDGPQPILAVAVRLRQGSSEWRYSPAVAEIVQVRARVGDQNVQLMPVPDARQFGNTQKAGCSWVLYKVRLSREWDREPLRLAVHAWLPAGVEARTEAWVVKRWWREDARPSPDGYYGDAPS